MNTHPIGIIDSGVGGLSVWRELKRALPTQATIYIADSKRCPYGGKTINQIYTYSTELIDALIKQNVQVILIACNTITTTVLPQLRKAYPDISFIGMVPAVKMASSITKNGRIGILATSATVDSDAVERLIIQFANHHRVLVRGSEELVKLVEQGKIEGEDVEDAIRKELSIFESEHIDTLVLGCTHFPFLRPVIEKLYPSWNIVDPNAAVVRRVMSVLGQVHGSNGKTSDTLLTTGDEKQFASLIHRLLDQSTLGKIQTVKGITL